MSVTIKVDRHDCQGYGNCVLASEAHFDLDGDGLVVLLKDTASADELDAVKRAAYDCPTEAITVVES